MRRHTKPFALLAAAIASKSAFAGLVGASATVTVTTSATNANPAPAAASSTTNFQGLTTGGAASTQMLIPFNTDGDGDATTTYTVAAGYNFGTFSLGADFILYTGLKLVSKLATAIFDVRVTSLTLSDGMSATAVFTFGGAGQLLSFAESTMMGIQTPSSSTTNTLTGTGTQSSWALSGGFGFGNTAITNISFTLVATQTDASPMDNPFGFHLDAIVGNAVPEPSSLALFGAGAGFAGFWIARRRRAARAQRK